MTGVIPDSLGDLSALTDLSIWNNQLTGSIPGSLGNLTALTVLDLSFNQLTGSIPASLGNLTKLLGLKLTSNRLTGGIPDSIGKLTTLRDLHFSFNQLSGVIPASLTNLINLRSLHLINNRLTGDVPNWSAIASLAFVDLRFNHLDISPGTTSRTNIDLMIKAGKQVLFEPQASQPCVEWISSASGLANNPNHWSSGTVPVKESAVCLGRVNGALNPIRVDLSVVAALSEFAISRLNVEGGSWVLAMEALVESDPLLPTVPKPKPMRLAETLSISSGAKLTVEGCTIITPKLEIHGNVTLGANNGTIRINGDLNLANSTSEITLELHNANKDVPMFLVDGKFLAGGKLRLTTPKSSPPEAGQRFRLVQFKPATKSVDEIFQQHQFKEYDPIISDELFWGLAFRTDFYGDTFIEAVVMKTPKLGANDGELLQKARRTAGLILVTHGTESDISPRTGLGQLAGAIDNFNRKYGNGDWTVASYDWTEYSTKLFPMGPNNFFINAATSAQIGLGLGESLAHWLEANNLRYTKMHLLSHSSGTWLINTLMQRTEHSAKIHLTFFDAFTNPVKAENCAISCNRFDSELGVGPNAAFVEHYVDRRPVFSPVGTDETLKKAVNFDITWAQGYPVTVIPTTTHSWPYEWYRKTVEAAANGVVSGDEHCAAFGLSPEFLESTVPSSMKKAAQWVSDPGPFVGEDIFIQGESCGTFPAPSFYSVPGIFQKVDPNSRGIVKIEEGGTVIWLKMKSPLSPQSWTGLVPLGTTAETAIVTSTITTTQDISGLSFDFRFTEQTEGVLSVFLDGALIQKYSQRDLSMDSMNSGRIRIFPSLKSGEHKLTFELASAVSGQAGIVISAVQIGVDGTSAGNTGLVSSAVSTLPGRFVPGETIAVQISVKPAPSVSVHAAEDEIPPAWSVSSISHDGEWDRVNNRIKWGPFFDNSPRELTYSVQSPFDTAPDVAFVGEASFDGAGLTIAGQRTSQASSRLGPVKRLANGKVSLEIRGGVGARYRIEVSSNLIDWLPIGTFSPTDGVLLFDDPANVGRPQTFYRAIRL